MAKRLTPEDWIAAGFRALAQDGPDAIKAEKLARQLGTSKGSFYWHFKDVPSFHVAMLALWEEQALHAITKALEELPTPQERIRVLAERASSPAPERFGGLKVEPAIRAWSIQNPQIAQGVAKVDAGRMAYLRGQLRAAGKDEGYATLIYCAYLGQDDLLAREGTTDDGSMMKVVEMILKHGG